MRVLHQAPFFILIGTACALNVGSDATQATKKYRYFKPRNESETKKGVFSENFRKKGHIGDYVSELIQGYADINATLAKNKSHTLTSILQMGESTNNSQSPGTVQDPVSQIDDRGWNYGVFRSPNAYKLVYRLMPPTFMKYLYDVGILKDPGYDRISQAMMTAPQRAMFNYWLNTYTPNQGMMVLKSTVIAMFCVAYKIDTCPFTPYNSTTGQMASIVTGKVKGTGGTWMENPIYEDYLLKMLMLQSQFTDPAMMVSSQSTATSNMFGPKLGKDLHYYSHPIEAMQAYFR